MPGNVIKRLRQDPAYYGVAPVYLCELIKIQEASSDSINLKIKVRHMVSGSFSCTASHEWNKLPLYIKKLKY